MNVRVEKRIAVCRELWNRFSPRESLFDLWEFRLPFWEVFRFDLQFIVVERDGRDVAMLPLWHHPEQRRFLWFGDMGDDFNWQEDTALWAESVEDVHALIDACPRPALLNSISRACAERWGSSIQLHPGNPKSVLPLAGMQTSEGYLQSLPKKLRSNVRRDQRAIIAREPEILTDDPAALTALTQLNVLRFEDSPFRDARMVRVFDRIVQAAPSAPYAVTTIAVRIDSEIAAVDLLFFHRAIAYSLLCGSNTQRYPGIGHFMTLLDIDAALKRSCTTIDFAEYDEAEDRTKSRFFPSVPQFTLALNA